ncbi:MAG: arginine--tRNA ligase, partial [Pseudobutyrivibrio sp.]|nr:arginine--tRNA ligase [Pseudobutyrivibrio sp.]
MKEILQQIKEEVVKGFAACGFDEKYAMVTLSNRPDLCQFQCNGAMAAAKEYKKAPIAIANEVVEKLAENAMFSKCEACPPGFINMNLSDEFIAGFVSGMAADTERFGVEKVATPKKVMIDYGGPNVAKPLHVGHLRSAIIGESIKRTARFMGDEVIGDVHLGDWGLQMGLIITELKCRHPELPYFDPEHTGAYPKEPPFTIQELAEIYPVASGKTKAA